MGLYQVIHNAISEEEILAATLPDTTGKEIVQGMEARSECCVVHLCGCN